MYQGEDYDLAGFCVGVVEKDAIIDGSRVSAGDAIIASPHPGACQRLLAHPASCWRPPARLPRPPSRDITSSTAAHADTYLREALLALLRAMPCTAWRTHRRGLSDNLPRVLPRA